MYEQRLITDVGIDMDGVVYPFMSAFRKYCVDVLKRDDFVAPTKWEFYEDWGISSAKFNNMLHTASTSHRLFASESPMETVEQAWGILRSLNVKIHVITARPATAWSQTAQWLHDYKLVPDHLHFTHDKAILAHTAQGHSAAIDDHYVYQQQMEKAGVLSVLHTHPWNSSHNVSFRANSLVEFAELVKNVNNREIPWLNKSVNKYFVTQSD